MDRRGALKGVEDIASGDSERRSCVWRYVEREAEYATELSVGWNITAVRGSPCGGVDVAKHD